MFYAGVDDALRWAEGLEGVDDGFCLASLASDTLHSTGRGTTLAKSLPLMQPTWPGSLHGQGEQGGDAAGHVWHQAQCSRLPADLGCAVGREHTEKSSMMLATQRALTTARRAAWCKIAAWAAKLKW